MTISAATSASPAIVANRAKRAVTPSVESFGRRHRRRAHGHRHPRQQSRRPAGHRHRRGVGAREMSTETSSIPAAAICSTATLRAAPTDEPWRATACDARSAAAVATCRSSCHIAPLTNMNTDSGEHREQHDRRGDAALVGHGVGMLLAPSCIFCQMIVPTIPAPTTAAPISTICSAVTAPRSSPRTRSSSVPNKRLQVDLGQLVLAHRLLLLWFVVGGRSIGRHPPKLRLVSSG